MKYTASQLADFRAYEKVRASGRFNMLDPRARHATGLDQDRFIFVLTHYDALAAQAAATRRK